MPTTAQSSVRHGATCAGRNPNHLEFELAVTRHDTPLSRTFVLSRRWNARTGAFVESAWQPGTPAMGGDEPGQLSGQLEVLSPRGEEQLPCGVVILDAKAGTARALAETSACTARFPDGITPALLAAESRREAIERAQTLHRTYDDLVAAGRARGLSEGDAMLRAGKEMERLGFFPKSPTLVASPAQCQDVAPLFRISDDEFRVGLFQDVGQALARPGTEVDKSMGEYVIHRDYDTSRRINEYLADRSHQVFFVEAHGRCWRLRLDRHEEGK